MENQREVQSYKEVPKKQVPSEKQKTEANETKLKIELELFNGGVQDEQFLNNYLKTYHNLNLNNYSQEQKQRIKDEIKIVLDELRGFDAGMIQGLRGIRESMSMGLESGKDDNYYKSMIVGKKIQDRIAIIQESLKTILGERVKVGNKEYNKADYTQLSTSMGNLDQVYGLDIFSKTNPDSYGFDLKKTFAAEVKKLISPSTPKYNLVASDLVRLPQIIGEKGFENLTSVVLKNGKTVNLEELFREYNKNYKDFQVKNKVFEVGNNQLKTAQKGFGFNESKLGLSYSTLEEVYAEKLFDLERVGVADLVIMMRVLFGVLPVAGDVVGGIDDLNQANAKVNFNGNIQGLGENIVSYMTGVLGISIAGGRLGVIAKGPKLIKIMSKLGQITDKLERSGNLSELAKNATFIGMLETMKGFIPSVNRLLEKIKSTTTPIKKVGESKKETVTSRIELSKSTIAHSTWLERGDVNLPNKLLKQQGLKELSEKQMEVVKKVHTEISKGLGKNKHGDLRKMTEELKKAGIDKNQIRVLMEKGITGEFKFDEDFFKAVSKAEDSINRSGIEEYLEKFAGKELSIEQLTAILKQNPKRFSDIKEFNEFLDVYDIKKPLPEMMIIVRKAFDTIHLKELVTTPKKIKIDDIIYFYKNGTPIEFNALLKNFAAAGEKTVLNDFINSFNNSMISISLEKINPDTLQSILSSKLIDKSILGKFIIGLSNSGISIENANILKAFLEKVGKDLFTQDMLASITSLINNKIDKFNPQNIVSGYLKGIDRDFYSSELSKVGSPARNKWNMKFEDEYDSKFEMIYRGKPEFFYDLNLDIFFNFNFSSLQKEQQGALYELIKTGGIYYEKIKGFKKYDEILELAKKGQKTKS